MKYRWRTAVVLFVTTHAAGRAPTFAVSTEGDCPSRDALVSALASKGYAVGGTSEPTEFSVVARADPAGASLCLRQGQQDCLLVRRFSSVDCRAVAEAMAVVIEAYFIDAAQLGYRATLPGSIAPAIPAPSGDSKGVLDAPSEIPAQAPPAATPQPPKAGLPPSAPPVPQPVLADRRDKDWLARGFVGAGAMLALPTVGISPLLELGGGIELASIPLSTDVAVMTSYPVETGSRPNRVWRWANQGLLRIGVPWTGELRVRPWAAVGLSMVRLRELDLPEPPTKTTSSVLIGAGLDATWPIHGNWFGRVDLGCVVIGSRDKYLVQPEEEIGAGPRVVCATTFGMGLGGRPFGR